MPNFCNNKLILTASNELLNKFWIENRLIDDKDNEYLYLSFNKSVPKPENEDDWYNWNINNWGTKWNACDCSVNEIESINDTLNKEYTNLNYQFDTAWDPPLEWLEKVANIYSDISFTLEYSEPNMDYYGKKEYINGELYSDKECPLSEYNWSKVNIDNLMNIIQKYKNNIKKYNIEEIADEIFEEYINEYECEYLENICGYIEDLIKDFVK